MAVPIEGLSVDAEIINSMQNKRDQVIEKPFYNEYETDNGKGLKEVVRKLKLKVRLSDEQVVDYYPNKTSIKAMVKLYGTDAELYQGKYFQWIVATGMYQGSIRKFLYVECLQINGFTE